MNRNDQWQDIINLILGIWLFVSPWVLGYSTAGTAAWNAWIIGVVVFVLSATSLAAFRQWEEWINVVLGIWLIVSPWVLTFSTLRNAAANQVIVGIIVGLLALWCAVAEHPAQVENKR